jgi:spore germination cell wall hydrolase CwlJ-like protein
MKRILSAVIAVLLLAALPAQAWAEEAEDEAEETTASSIFDLLEGSQVNIEIDMVAYYLTQMGNAAVEGKLEEGRQAGENRNALIELNGSDEQPFSFDDLYLLAKLINAEAGSDWLSDDFRLCVGEVVLNRVASPEFPDTISEVVYQKNQYSSVNYSSFYSLVPNRSCVDVAIRLLRGERQMVPSVVFQSDDQQGEIFSLYKDRRLGTTFFCVSPNQELYNE